MICNIVFIFRKMGMDEWVKALEIHRKSFMGSITTGCNLQSYYELYKRMFGPCELQWWLHLVLNENNKGISIIFIKVLDFYINWKGQLQTIKEVVKYFFFSTNPSKSPNHLEIFKWSISTSKWIQITSIYTFWYKKNYHEEGDILFYFNL